jgi:hypothetical protein
MTARPSVLGKPRGQTLGAVLNAIALAQGDHRVLPPAPVPPAEPGRRGGSEMGGNMQMVQRPKELPFWWPGI